MTASTGAYCPNCGTANDPGTRFCASCGRAMTPTAAAAPLPPTTSITALLTQVAEERTGFLAAGVVVVVCAVLALVAWYPLGLPSKLIRDEILPNAVCTGTQEGTTAMYFCSAKVGMLQIVGPVIMMVLVFVFRKQLKAQLDKIAPDLPPEARFLFAPIIATLAFTLSWSGFHYHTSGQSGILPQTIFPAAVGLFTFSVARWGADWQRKLTGFFDFREGIPTFLRFVLVIGVPVLLSFLLTHQKYVSHTALKEQVVVLVALTVGFLMLAPRSGDVLAGMGQALTVRTPARQ